MRTTLTILGLAALLFTIAATTPALKAPEGNLIQNPSLEERMGPPQGYPKEPWGYGLMDTIARSPFAHWGYSGFFDGGDYDIKLGEGHSGKLCARLVCRKRARGGICTDIIRVKPGTKLKFSGYFKASDAKGKCYVSFEGHPGDGWAIINLPDKPDYDWTQVTGEVTVPPPAGKRTVDENGNTQILVFIYTKAYGELWIDDVTLTPIAEPEAAADQN